VGFRIVFWAWFVLVNLFATGRALYLTFGKNIPTEPYQIWWPGVVGIAELALAVGLLRWRARMPGPSWLIFSAAALLFCMAEELTCYLVRTGIFRHLGEVSTVVLFAVATSLLWLCALGGYACFRLLHLKWHQALLLFAFSGFILEAFPFQKLYRTVPLPILLGLFPPAAAWHYVLIGLIPFVLVRSDVESRARWDHPMKWIIGLVLPLAVPTIIVLTVLR
jgi:hypothetical protein